MSKIFFIRLTLERETNSNPFLLLLSHVCNPDIDANIKTFQHCKSAVLETQD